MSRSDTAKANSAKAARGSALSVRVKRLPHAGDLPLPSYQSAGAAGLDLVAALPEGMTVLLAPMARALVPTGLVIGLPAGVEAQVRPRSGLALKNGITVLNSPGTIDSDYRGEVKVLLINLGEVAFSITRGERIAQLVVQRVEQAALVEVATLDATTRGQGGFGSTGAETPTMIKRRGAAGKPAAAPRKPSRPRG